MLGAVLVGWTETEREMRRKTYFSRLFFVVVVCISTHYSAYSSASSPALTQLAFGCQI